MAQQYLYPTSVVSNNWVSSVNTASLSMYRDIDEGVSYPNDNDYIISSGTGASNGFFRFSAVDTYINPSTITLNFRASGVGLPWTNALEFIVYSVKDNLGNHLFEQQIGNDGYVLSDVWENYTISNNWSGTTPANLTYIDVHLKGVATLSVPRLHCSAIELILNGTLIPGNVPTSNNNATLYINGPSPNTSGVTLYTEGPTQNTSGITLYTSGPIPYSGDYNPTLYTSGPIPYSGDYNPTLFLDCDPPDGNVPLYISHADTIDSLPTGLPLFIAGHGSDYSGLDLFILGGMNRSFDLYIKSDPYPISSGNTPLVIWPLGAGGSGTLTGDTTLYTLNYVQESGAFPLYIAGPASGEYNSSFPINIFNLGDANKSLDMYMAATVSSGDMSTTLFTSSFYTDSGNAPLYISGPASGQLSNNHTLYIRAVDPLSYDNVSGRKLLPFVMYNNLRSYSGEVNLSIGNGFPSSGYHTLFIDGGGIVDEINSIPLFINSRVNSSGDVPLTLLAGIALKPLDMFIQAKELTGDSGSPTLFIYSADGSGAYHATELFMSSDNYGTRIPMYLAAAEYGTLNSGFPLYIGYDQGANLGLPLYLESVRSSGDAVKLYVGGEGFINGASVQRGEIPLYIARPVDSDSYSTPLYFAGPSGEIKGLEMSITGGTYTTGYTTLAIPTVVGTTSGNMEWFIHGF